MFDILARVSPLPPGFADMAPGAMLATTAASVRHEECNGYELEELIRCHQHLIAWLEAECLAAVAALAHCPPGLPESPAVRCADIDPHGAAVLEPLLGWSQYHAGWYYSLALSLADLPRTRAALAAGELDLAAVRIIAERLAVLSSVADMRAVEDALFPDAVKLSAGVLRIRVEAEVIKVDPTAAAERHRRAREGRGVDVSPAIDGVADLRLHGIPADQAAEAYAYLDAIARSMKSAGDTRTLPQLRADFAAGLLSGRADVSGCDSSSTEASDQKPHDTDDRNDMDNRNARQDRGDSGDSGGDRPSTDGTDGRDGRDGGRSGAERTGSQGCPHSGCDHDHHDQFCPCADCKPAAPTQQTERTVDEPGVAGPPVGEQPGANPVRRGPSAFVPPDVRVRAKIQFNVPLTTLLGLGGQPGELGGFGPVVDEVTRRIIANQLQNPDARFSVGVTHPTNGQLLHLHPVPHRFLRGLQAELVEAVHQRCAWITCRRPAATCDLDHLHDYAGGGDTSVDNTAPECPGHHKVKTEANWTVTQTRPGAVTWIDPHGRHYTKDPPALTDPVPDHHDPPPF